MHEKIVNVMEDTEHDICSQEDAKWITILDAMYMLSVAWVKVSSQTIKHWIKAGFVSVEESNEDIDDNEDLILPSPPTGLTKKQFKNWLSIDDGDIVVPEITEAEKLGEIIHDIWQLEKETERHEDGNSDIDVDERFPDSPPPVEMRHYPTQLESGFESFDFSNMNLFRTLKEKINAEL
ncbi:Hypothetical predicted protein [Octopus vulgaris]|uniref:DDE-1 domain-containing protein n=1 Tax=Octopus vulgaris TaxID=6645 RepID=A0AA36B210_OCTVU|nr:Hypothetical predicted protein [Octopus vulgaris]